MFPQLCFYIIIPLKLKCLSINLQHTFTLKTPNHTYSTFLTQPIVESLLEKVSTWTFILVSSLLQAWVNMSTPTSSSSYSIPTPTSFLLPCIDFESKSFKVVHAFVHSHSCAKKHTTSIVDLSSYIITYWHKIFQIFLAFVLLVSCIAPFWCGGKHGKTKNKFQQFLMGDYETL